MKKVLSVLLVLGLLLSVGFASTSVTKIPKKSPSQNFVEAIDTYLHYELINPAASKEFKDQIRFFMNEREKNKKFEIDLVAGKLILVSNKATVQIKNENVKEVLLKEVFTPEEINSLQKGPITFIIKRVILGMWPVIRDGIKWEVIKWALEKCADGVCTIIKTGTSTVPAGNAGLPAPGSQAPNSPGSSNHTPVYRGAF